MGRVRLDRSRVSTDYDIEYDTRGEVTHAARMNVTAALVAWPRPETVLDPACGDGTILLTANRIWPFQGTMGDISQANIDALEGQVPEGWALHVGDAEETIRRVGKVDMIVLTEFLEHVEDPDAVLRLAREHADVLVASSPEMRPGQSDFNPEHLWQFDGKAYHEMLKEAGWSVHNKTHLTFGLSRVMQLGDRLVDISYDFQIWVCS